MSTQEEIAKITEEIAQARAKLEQTVNMSAEESMGAMDELAKRIEESTKIVRGFLESLQRSEDGEEFKG